MDSTPRSAMETSSVPSTRPVVPPSSSSSYSAPFHFSSSAPAYASLVKPPIVMPAILGNKAAAPMPGLQPLSLSTVSLLAAAEGRPTFPPPPPQVAKPKSEKGPKKGKGGRDRGACPTRPNAAPAH